MVVAHLECYVITAIKAAHKPAKSSKKQLDLHGIVCSMSSWENCYDNAVVESF